MIKLLTMYLPQFHQIAENDEFWGKGFTDWVTVKNAKPLFEGHQQPRIPLNENYYDLSIKENVAWQAKLAKTHGIYGFGIYHYWFNNDKNLLTKPAEIILENKDIDINFFYAWDNISWKRSWSNVKEKGNAWAPDIENKKQIKKGPSILIPYIIGNERDWENHYNYLLPFFKDERYIKVDNKPMFIIFHYDSTIEKMCQYWNELSQKDGFSGIHFILRYVDTIDYSKNWSLFKYEPVYSGWTNHTIFEKIKGKVNKLIANNKNLKIYDYDKVWKNILRNALKTNDKNIYHSAFVSYDDTPRRGNRGIVVQGASPNKFVKYLSDLIRISSFQNKEYIFVTAWNEWGEGAFLEPDSENGYEYLTQLKDMISTL